MPFSKLSQNGVLENLVIPNFIFLQEETTGLEAKHLIPLPAKIPSLAVQVTWQLPNHAEVLSALLG